MAERPLPAYTGDKPHVFVSYSHDDTRIVSREIRWLQDQGFNVWWDEGISPGSSWSQALAEEIEGCSLFLLFVSPSAVASDNCHREVAFALDTHRAFLAVHLEHTDLPSGWKLNIGDKQAIIRDRLSFEEYRHRLADGVKKHVLTAPVPESSVDAESRRPFLTTNRWPGALTVVVLLAVVGFAVNSYLELRQSAINEQWANEQIPWMEQLIGEQRYVEAFDLVTQLRNRVPDRPEVSDLLMRTSQVSQITTQPSGAEVAYRFFGRQEDRWITLGVTPLQARVPNGAKVWRFTKEGYEAQVLISRYNPSGYFGTIRLQPTDSVPDGMVFVQGGEISDPPLSPRLSVDSFYIDRYEVTNEDYQAFVDAGGYSDPSYWREMVFVNKERKIDRSEAMQLFVDSTGRAGPAGWVLGQHPDGQEAWPVRGVSWYEAAAYARFVGKALPTAAHWSVAAFDRNVFGQKSFDASVAGRNLQIDKLAPIGTSHRSRVDARDMFGNVREWVLNEKGEDRVVMGASWKQYVSMGWLVDSAPPLDRSEINGIRLARYDRDVKLEAKIEPRRITRNPISEEAYQLLLSDLTYAPVDIDIADIRQSVKGLNWSHDSIPISLPDGDVLIVHVFLPTSAPKPYQVVLYAPGAGSYYVREFTGYDPGLDPRFIIKTGRALVFPEYEGTFSRRSSVNDATEVWDAQAQRDDMITRRNETAIALDYVASREDLAADQIAYLGFSVSASLYIPILAVENRFKTAILVSGGLEVEEPLHPIADQVNYVTRIKMPVLMINGRYDGVYPYETSQQALFNFLGSEDKKHVALPAGGHGLVPQIKVMEHVADWLDDHLGPVD